jgi:hypothetical protein
MSRKKTQNAFNSYLVAANALAQTNQLVEAEIRYKDTLRKAEKDYGAESDQVMLVSSILASFYRGQNREHEALEVEARLYAWTMPPTPPAANESHSRFVKGSGNNSGNHQAQDSNDGVKIPASLRKSCQVLGISPDQSLTETTINKAWKKQMLSKGAHPDLGGNTDEAILLNRAKEELMLFLDERAPKLGAKFKRA